MLSSSARVKNAADVESEIALALHLTVTGAASSRETLFRYLEMKESLLVLDNFEHVIDAASNVTELLERCPRVTVLVTSREALRLPAEHEYVVPPLREPSAIDSPSIARRR